MLFRSKAVRRLDAIIDEIKINLSNNYKEPAHIARKKLISEIEMFHDTGKLSEKEYAQYKTIAGEYTEMMKDYHH